MLGQFGIAGEAAGACDLGDDLGCGQRRAAGQREQRSRLLVDERAELALEFVGAPGQLADPNNELAGDPDLGGLTCPSEPSRDPVEPDEAAERSGRDLEAGIEIVQVPAQAVLDRRSLADEIVSVVEQQTDLAPPPARNAAGRSGSRRAARATATASIRSDLPGERPLLRASPISRGGTRTTRSPRASRKRSSEPETCRQSSSAHSRSGLSERAQSNSSPCPRSRAATVRSPSSSPVVLSTAAAV